MQHIWEPFIFQKLFLPLAMERFLSTSSCPFTGRFTLKGNATNLRTFCFKDHHYESFCLSRDSLSCATRSLDLCILFTFMFYTSDTLRPILALLTHFAYTDFFTCILSCGGEYFSHPWWCRWSGRARNLILIFTFSSQRPHLNHI